MKSVLLMCWMALLSVAVSAQDFASRFLTEHKADSNLKVVEKNSGRFEPFLSFKDKAENCQIMIRKKKDAIVELVMLMHEKNQFAVINFTGNMSPEFISKLAASMKPKRS